MKIALYREHSSISKLKTPDSLPWLTIITGENGCGKTHLLQALETGKALATVDDRELSAVHKSNKTLRPTATPCTPQELLQKQGSLWNIFSDFLTRKKDIRNASIVKILSFQNIVQSDVIKDYFSGKKVSEKDTTAILKKLKTERIDWLSQDISDFVIRIENAAKSTQRKIGGKIQTIPADLVHKELAQYLKLLSGKPSPTTLDGARAMVRGVEKTTGKSIYDVTALEFRAGVPLQVESDPFSASLSEWFVDYYKRFWTHAQPILEKSDSPSVDELKNAYTTKNGNFPWDEVNMLLQTAGFDLVVTSPSSEGGNDFNVQFSNLAGTATFTAGELSSGEQIIVALAPLISSTVRNAESEGFPELLLFDEIDASLHPQLIATLLKVLHQDLIERHKLRIIFVTHSPSTVALAPEESIFVLEQEGTSKTLKKATKDEALAVLTAGISSSSLAYENRRQVIVESSYDALYFSHIYSLIKEKDEQNRHVSLSFISSGGNSKGDGGCDRVSGLVNAFRKDKNEQVLGVIDWDKKNRPAEHIKVLANKSRYSVENCILDPFPLLILLLSEGIDCSDLGCPKDMTAKDLLLQSDEMIQRVINSLVNKILGQKKSGKTAQLSYLEGRTLTCDDAYLSENGHNLEDSLIRTSFPTLSNKYQNKHGIKTEITSKTFRYFPETIPTVFLDLFESLRKTKP